jgi:hypothetical protein
MELMELPAPHAANAFADVAVLSGRSQHRIAQSAAYPHFCRDISLQTTVRCAPSYALTPIRVRLCSGSIEQDYQMCRAVGY